jgi:hypothetical protein
LVEEKFPGCTLIYGDTDSVMINFHVKTGLTLDLSKKKKNWFLTFIICFLVAVDEAMVLGRAAAKEITSTFLSLEFEKVHSSLSISLSLSLSLSLFLSFIIS